MRYTVRTPSGGELQFDGIEQLRTSFAHGLVDPDDEVREGDAERWVKARSVPVLAMAMDPRARRGKRSAEAIRLYLLVALLATSLALLAFGQWGAGLVLALFGSLLLTRQMRRTARGASSTNLRSR